mgnify:FL=1
MGKIRPRIAFVIHDLCVQGAQYVTALLVRGFHAKGYDVDLLLAQVHWNLLAQGKVAFQIPFEVNIVRLPHRRARHNVLALRHYLKHTGAGTVISMSVAYDVALALASIGIAPRPKLCAVDHLPTGADFETGELRERSWRQRLHDWLYCFTYSRLDLHLCVSKGVAEGNRRLYGTCASKLRVVYNPVVDEICEKNLQSPPQCGWLRKKECPTFVAAGAYNRIKNHLMLFEAIRLANMRQPVRLVLFGGDSEECLTDQYESFIRKNHLEDKIMLYGFSRNLPAELRAADGFINSSIVESFSVVLVEALAAGCPVISTDCPFGPREILHDGEYGILCENKNPVGLADAICRVVNGGGINPPMQSWMPYTVESIVEMYETNLKT